MRLVQIVENKQRRVAAVNGAQARYLKGVNSIYELALEALQRGQKLEAAVEDLIGLEALDYTDLLQGKGERRLLPAFDHPFDAAHCMVAGTGLTHKASAENRARMHQAEPTTVTDSMRMYQWGLDEGRPASGTIGVQPEWFFKGDGSVLRAHGEALDVPSFGDDGGEEPEIAGAYVIAPDGSPHRVGLMQGNEFSDHVMEKKNYLYLAPSKLRSCSIGPELLIGEVAFEAVEGRVRLLRKGAPVWSHSIFSGERNMSHSVANLEHHHFKYPAHRRPGDAHIHFFGADAFSFGAGFALEEGDKMEVSFEGFGAALRNPIHIESKPEAFVRVAQA